MKKIYISGIILLLFITAYYSHPILKKSTNPNDSELHYHAGFEVYKDGKLMDFTSLEYMDVKPCGNDDKDTSHEVGIPEVHLHDSIGNIVHIHRHVATWGDLLKKLKVNVSHSEIDVYLGNNPTSLQSALAQNIKPYDQAIIFINSPDNRTSLVAEGISRISVQYIKDVEKKGENCSK